METDDGLIEGRFFNLVIKRTQEETGDVEDLGSMDQSSHHLFQKFFGTCRLGNNLVKIGGPGPELVVWEVDNQRFEVEMPTEDGFCFRRAALGEEFVVGEERFSLDGFIRKRWATDEMDGQGDHGREAGAVFRSIQEQRNHII